jgi:hypothetical protein
MLLLLAMHAALSCFSPESRGPRGAAGWPAALQQLQEIFLCSRQPQAEADAPVWIQRTHAAATNAGTRTLPCSGSRDLPWLLLPRLLLLLLLL